MLNKFYFYFNPEHDPHKTLALEEYMVMNVGADEIILYLYTHADTVVIGRNQNAWSECRHEQLLADGGKLARRVSGGGAVFHDIANLNFSFVVSQDNYDLHRQLKVILDAVRSFGIHAEFSGRNDILADGRKFSGNAFCHKKNNAFHHGTIMIDTDTDKLAKYLAVSKDKIESKGISSVRSRVVNLSELNPDITPELIAQALKRSFESEYGVAQPYPITPQIENGVDEIAKRNASWEWLFGQSPSFDISISNRFAWGGIELQLSLRDALIKEARIFSDAMDADLIESIPEYLSGIRFQSQPLADAIRTIPHTQEQSQVLDDIADYILEQKY
ncbi:lipoate--protein ligase [Christensenellaceae bacterium OttesenSCG-928-K19]|nr:lipoate--protein ligase [Christensenellaceae bacterium OttesenSCG-928-K19]